MPKDQPKEIEAKGIVSDEKLFNKKYYRTVNIDLTEENKAKKSKKSGDETNAKTTEDYKNVLRGMGFKID